MRIELDTRKFHRALKEYGQATGKDGAEILNRAGRNVAYKAAQYTPIANAAKIRSALFKDPHLRYALTSIALRKRGVGILKSPEFAKEVKKMIGRRVSSSRYLRSAWAEAIEKLGGTFKGAKFRGASGDAKKATLNNLLTVLVAITSQPDRKRAAGAEAIGMKALQKAIEATADDMIQYAERLMSQRAKQHSAA